MLNKNKYIQLLEWGRDNINGVTEQTIVTKLKELDLPSGHDGMQGTLNLFTRNIFHRLGDKYMLTFDAYFHLFEHERLQEARIESKKATRIAMWAIWITIIVSAASIIIGFLQLFKQC